MIDTIPRPLSKLTDAELVLLDAVIASGGRARPRRADDAEAATDAMLLNVRLEAAVRDELRARRLTPEIVACRVVEAALRALG